MNLIYIEYSKLLVLLQDSTIVATENADPVYKVTNTLGNYQQVSPPSPHQTNF
jgi:hypothetical protein